jgi:hypothetical protein
MTGMGCCVQLSHTGATTTARYAAEGVQLCCDSSHGRSDFVQAPIMPWRLGSQCRAQDARLGS